MNWIELYYLLSARKILTETKTVFGHLVKTATSMLSVGTEFQHNVFRAQLELTQVESKLIEIEEDIKIVRANLARLVGPKIARIVHPRNLPKWSNPSAESSIRKNIMQHPVIKSDDSAIEANQKGIELSEELYKPAWSLGLQYSFRQGRMSQRKRSDFVGVQITTELPFFTSNRQDKRVTASLEQYKASKSQKEINLLNLSKEVSHSYAAWMQLKKQENLYKTKLVPEAKQYAEAALNAYENTQVAFLTVAKAYDMKLTTLLQSVRIETKRQKARAYLLYLEAEEQ
ncbi:MAG: TolC family protein [Alphaproteobacteria bacterium]|jgi:outer membrane protein TolC|nr:TolC family protein [Alphaproteobacteria bacterium]MBT5389534.1 TolC family protein [Alphaproteobacteria bacterium]